MGAFEDALSDYARAVELAPRSPKPFAYRAWTYAKLHQLEAGLKDVDRALKLDANSAEAHWARAELHQAQRQTAAAILDLQKAVNLDPAFKEPTRVLNWLGVNQRIESTEVKGAGRDGWRILSNGRQYVAKSDQVSRVSIDVEMVGLGDPRILEWQMQKDQFAGIGLLRFYVGSVQTSRGQEDVEQIAIVDVTAGTVAGYETAKRGGRSADLSWDDGMLSVVSADGTREDYQLRPSTRAKETPVAAQQPPKRVAREDRKQQWGPWDEYRRGKPKSLFDLLFGN
jgi:tetratricopeptide (TPR) repeat protein